MNIWELIKKYFSRDENWGDPDKLNPTLLVLLYIIRVETGWAIVIHNAYELSGHTDNSQHYKGNAADWHFVTPVTYKEQVDKVLSILNKWRLDDKVGIGIYPNWNNPGFHTDVRCEKARWGYIGDKQVSFEAAKAIIG